MGSRDPCARLLDDTSPTGGRLVGGFSQIYEAFYTQNCHRKKMQMPAVCEGFVKAVEQKYRQKVELRALGVSEVWLPDWEGKVEHVDDWVWGYRWGSQDPSPIRLWTFFLFNGELLIPFVLVRGALAHDMSGDVRVSYGFSKFRV